MDWLTWYTGLVKPSWTPAPATIGLIWQILYPIILVSFGFVFVQAFRGKLGWWLALPFAINLVANLIFTPIQFGMRSLPLAAVDIVIVWGTNAHRDNPHRRPRASCGKPPVLIIGTVYGPLLGSRLTALQPPLPRPHDLSAGFVHYGQIISIDGLMEYVRSAIPNSSAPSPNPPKLWALPTK